MLSFKSITLFFVALFLVACSQQRSTSIPTSLPTIILTSIPIPTATLVPTVTPLPSIGQAVTIGGLEWIVLEAKDYGNHFERKDNSDNVEAKTDGKFIWVHYHIKAVQSGDQLLKDHIQLHDGAGNNYKSFYSGDYMNTELLKWIPDGEHCPLDGAMQHVMKKDETLTCQAVFDIPTNSKELQVVVGSFGFGKEYGTINLGL